MIRPLRVFKLRALNVAFLANTTLPGHLMPCMDALHFWR